MSQKNRIILAGLATLALAVCPASASLLIGDGNAMAAWKGVRHFADELIPGYYRFEADVEYAVYEPGNFTLSFPGQAVDATHYVYAYLVTNITGNAQFAGIDPRVLRSTVGLADVIDGTNEDELPTLPTYVPDANRIAPYESVLNVGANGPSSIFWRFDPWMVEGDESTVLYFSSPFEPEWDSGLMTGEGGATGGIETPLPSPAPEPTTIALMAMGGIFAVRKRK